LLVEPLQKITLTPTAFFMNHFFRLLLVVFLLTSGSTVFAQLTQGEQDQINQMMPNPVPKSPNAAALDKFGDYPVSYFTGLPEISIPIFEVKSGGLSVPISLSYHPSGIRPTDQASWVGLGWSLSAGGQISRKTNGKPDEQYYYTNSLVGSPGPCTSYYFLKGSAEGASDTQADVFSYTFPGKNGKFLLSQGGNPPYLVPYEPFIVNTTFVNNNAFSKFEITDEKGVLHRFGTNSLGTSSTESSAAVNGGIPNTSTTSWNLMEMIAPSANDQISFTYQHVGTSVQYDVSYAITVQDQASTIAYLPFPYLTPTRTIPCSTTVNQEGISTITYKLGKVEFVLGDDRGDGGSTQDPLKSLAQINIYSLINGSYILLKSVKFTYSYFTNAIGRNQSLKLDQLQFLDGTGATVEQYKFTYFTNSFSWDPTNTNFLNARDLWGFYNGAVENTDLILATTIPFMQTNSDPVNPLPIGGATDRDVDTTYTKEGTLKRIDFPTGGYTQFSFENNQYSLTDGSPAVAGGLRLSKIISSDGSSAPPIVKTYKYGPQESGLGVANFSQSQFNYSSTQTVWYIACAADNSSWLYRSRTYYSSSA
jgi:hypothetical protein